MDETQQLAFELRLKLLRRLHSAGSDLKGCLLAACSAHDADPDAQIAMLKFLVSAGVSINETDKNGVTPLHRAVRFRSLAAVDFLLAAGADVHATDRKSHATALHRAVTNTGAPKTAGKSVVAAAIVRSLLAHGADLTTKNKMGKTVADYRLSEAVSAALYDEPLDDEPLDDSPGDASC